MRDVKSHCKGSRTLFSTFFGAWRLFGCQCEGVSVSTDVCWMTGKYIVQVAQGRAEDAEAKPACRVKKTPTKST